MNKETEEFIKKWTNNLEAVLKRNEGQSAEQDNKGTDSRERERTATTKS